MVKQCIVIKYKLINKCANQKLKLFKGAKYCPGDFGTVSPLFHSTLGPTA